MTMAVIGKTPQNSSKRHKRMKSKSILDPQKKAGSIFVLPSMAIFTVFVYIPLAFSFIFSLFKTNLMFNNIEFLGIQNYITMAHDDRFWNALINTGYYTILTVPIQTILALLVAVALKNNNKINNFFKTVYFIPAICSMTVISIVWSFLLNKDISMIGYLLSKVGIALPELLNNPTLAMPTVIAVSVWKNIGFNMVILIGGLQGISDSYYEAADIDGANSWDKMVKITIPMLMPTLSFVIVNSLISSFQVFDQVFVMTKGGPLFKTETIVQYIYNVAFTKNNIGYASAIAVVLLLITLAVSLTLFKQLGKNEKDLA